MSDHDLAALARFVAERRWFRSKARRIVGQQLVDRFEIEGTSVVLLGLRFEAGPEEIYFVPHVSGERIVDPLVEGDFGRVLAGIVADERTIRGHSGLLRGRKIPGASLGDLPPARALGAEQSNTTIAFDRRLIMKVYRQTIEGRNPEVEILRFLSIGGPAGVPRLHGELEWIHDGRTSAVAMIQDFVPSRGDAWAFWLERLAHVVEQVRSQAGAGAAPAPPVDSPFDLIAKDPPQEVTAVAARELEIARLLGERLAGLHVALSTGSDPLFAPESLGDAAREALLEKEQAAVRTLSSTLRERRDLVPASAAPMVSRLVERGAEIEERLRSTLARPIATPTIRVHGDLHLGQVLVTPDDDLVIIDFEGEPARTLEERCAKGIPLRDVAGVLRSFDYAAATAEGMVSSDRARVAAWLEVVRAWSSAAFLRAWSAGVAGSAAAPANEAEARRLLDLGLLEKGVYEVGYELNNRPSWLAIPLRGLLALLDHPPVC